MKHNFRLLDVIVQAAYLKKLENRYLQNVYSLGPQTLLLKFNKPGEERQLLIIEAGRRAHITKYTRSLPSIPSQDVMKIRQHLRSKRLSSVKHVDGDRIIEFKFEKGRDIDTYYLQVQLFSSGTIVLYNHTRSVIFSLKPLHKQGAAPDQSGTPQKSVFCGEDGGLQRILMEAAIARDEQNTDSGEIVYCEKQNVITALKNTVGNELADLILKKSNIEYKDKKAKDRLSSLGESEGSRLNAQDLERLRVAVAAIETIFKDAPKGNLPGWVSSKKSAAEAQQEDAEKDLIGFYPYDPECGASNTGVTIQYFETFDSAVDYYFYRLESAKVNRESNAVIKKKASAVDAAKTAQEQNIKMLESISEDALAAAKALERDLQLVDKLLSELKICFDDGWDWVALGEFIEDCASQGIPQAQIVHKINYADRKVTVKLRKVGYEGKDEENESPNDDTDPNSYANVSTGPPVSSKHKEIHFQDSAHDNGLKYDASPKAQQNLKGIRKKLMKSRKVREDHNNILIDLDVDISALSNLTKMYAQKRTADTKKTKTEDSIKKVLKKVEKQSSSKSSSSEPKLKTITKIRTPYWFESFIWSISPENYLIVSGADASKKDIILRRYMSSSDILVSADIEGALLVLIKNNNPDEFIGVDTLNHAGAVALCYSKAWSSKTVMSPWWVYPKQVITEDSSGVPFDKGVFFVEGEKNWLHYVHLSYGLGILFNVGSECKMKHLGERCPDNKRPYTLGDRDHLINGDEPNGTLDRSACKPLDNFGSMSVGGKTLGHRGSSPKVTVSAKKEGLIDKMPIKSSAKIKKSGDKPKTQVLQKEGNSSKEKKECDKGKDSVKVASDSGKQIANTVGQFNTKVRGKHGKIKKAKSKYQDQDEEDRILYEILHNPRGVDKNDLSLRTIVQDKIHKTNEDEQTEQSGGTQENKDDNIVTSESFPVKKKIQNSIESRKREPFVYNPSVLDEFTATPHSDDQLYFAVPVCGPWSTIRTYKHKVKLIPGSMKRSLAIKSCINAILCPKGSSKAPRSRREGDISKTQENGSNDDKKPARMPLCMTEAEKSAICSISDREFLFQILTNVKLDTSKA